MPAIVELDLLLLREVNKRLQRRAEAAEAEVAALKRKLGPLDVSYPTTPEPQPRLDSLAAAYGD